MSILWDFKLLIPSFRYTYVCIECNLKSNKILNSSWTNSTIYQWGFLTDEILLKKGCVSNFCYKKWVILLQPQACKIVEESCIRKVSVISQIPHDAYEYKWWEIREMYSTNNKEKHIFHLEDILGIPRVIFSIVKSQ